MPRESHSSNSRYRCSCLSRHNTIRARYPPVFHFHLAFWTSSIAYNLIPPRLIVRCHYARKSLSPSNERTNGKSNLGEKRNNKSRVGFISYFKILNSDTLEAIVKCNREDWTKISRKRDKSDRNKQISLSRSTSLSLSLVSRYNTPHCWIHLRSRIFKSFLFQTVFDTEISKA